MKKIVDYYFAPMSPFTYLGHDRFVALASRHGATVALKPVDLGKVFPVSGGLPLAKRAPQRQAYRLVELERWSAFLDKQMHIEPRYFPVAGDLASGAILAADALDPSRALALAGAVGRAVWEQQRDIADAATISAIVDECGMSGAAVLARAETPDIATPYAALTQEAVARGIFGVPTYVYREECFWGQDRLDFLDRALAQ
jgi:2-hydroxychromene-2-carboxylate isomerase